MSDPTNPVQAGSDSARPADDNSNWNLDDDWEPNDEPQGDVEANSNEDGDQTGNDSATDEAAQDEAADQEAEDAPQEAEKAPQAAPDDAALVTLPSGEQVTFAELKAGYSKEADYRLKTQVLATRRNQIEETYRVVEQAADAIAKMAAERIPPEPPLDIIHTDMALYLRMEKAHQAGVREFEQFMAHVQAVKGVKPAISADVVKDEQAKLEKRMPEYANPKTRSQFVEAVFKAGEELGYSREEIASRTDHREAVVLYYANLGLQAQKAKAQIKAKTVNVPPATPPRRAAPPASVNASRQNEAALKRLNRTGSLEDAMSVDF